jgi:hypothetical protein
LEAGPALDPFDPEALRMSQDFGVELGVQKVLLTVPVRKPDKAWFVRVHPAKEYELTTARLTALLSTVDACIPNPFLTAKKERTQ